VNLGLELSGELVRRSYSLASAPGAPLEFYLAEVSGGAFTPALFKLEVEDPVWVEPKPQGFFTLEWVPAAEELWMVATGTGLAPFISMLRSGEPLTRFSRVVVVHGVRQSDHLGYADELAALSRAHAGRLIWVPVVSRERTAALPLHGRITDVLSSGELEHRVELELAPARSHVMLCGNPAMIDEVQTLLEARGMRRHRVRKPGHVTIERYWD
jgi:ferredoxin--NADP+ reductase